ncbi:MAG: PEP-CTERM sorting domain-containing protein [Phycisphaerales bacterium JB059]
MKVQTGVITAFIAGAACSASGQISSATGLTIASTPIEVAASEGAGTFDVNISSMVHNNIQGSSWNKSMRLDVGEDMWVTGLGWDVNATTIDPMLLSDVSIAIFNSLGEGVVLNPFDSQDFVGAGASTSGEMINLILADQEFEVSDGQIFIEFFLPSNPIAGPEATYGLGSMLHVQVSSVPAPGTLALGMGALGMVARRRR